MAELQRIRSDLRAFADVARCPLEAWQARALDLATRTTAIVAPRQSGKSRSLAVLALWWAYRRPEQRVLIVSAGEEASRRLLGQVRRVAAGAPLLAGSVVDEQAGMIEALKEAGHEEAATALEQKRNAAAAAESAAAGGGDASAGKEAPASAADDGLYGARRIAAAYGEKGGEGS